LQYPGGAARKYSSKFKGVSYHPEKKLWFARLTIKGKVSYVGYFKKEQDAAEAYTKAVELRDASNICPCCKNAIVRPKVTKTEEKEVDDLLL